MLLLLGANSYVGHAFARALRWRKDAFIPLSRETFDYTQFEFLFDYIRKTKPELLINADEFSGTAAGWSNGGGVAGDNSDSSNDGSHELNATRSLLLCAESERTEMLHADVLLPQTISRACALTNTPWGHVSSGSIYSGAKVLQNGRTTIEVDLGLPANRALFTAHPERFSGFTELDEPNFSFRSPPCTFYSGSKALAEEALQNTPAYIWRLRLPFNEQDESHNFLSQLQDGWRINDAINSLSHLDDCVAACLELWDKRAPFGIYNVVNPGAVLTSDIMQRIQRIRRPLRRLQLLDYDRNSHSGPERAPWPNCILDPAKLLKTGVRLQPVHQAIDRALEKWQRNSAAALRTTA